MEMLSRRRAALAVAGIALLALFALCGPLPVRASEERSGPSDVTVLGPDNFDDIIGGEAAVLVKFYAPWCGHCKKLAPDWEILATTWKNMQNEVKIAKLDCDQHKDLCSKHGVSGYPTLKFFPKASTVSEDYNEGRSAEEATQYLNNKLNLNIRLKKAPSAVTVLTDSIFEEMVLDPTKDVMVEFYAPWCGHCKSLAPDYEKVAAAYAGEKDIIVANLDADKYKDVGSKYGVSGFPTIKWFGKDSKDEPESYDGARAPQDFVDFINEKTGAMRELSGGLKPEAGKVPELDELAAEFIKNPTAADLIKKAEEIVSGLTGRLKTGGEVYLKAFNSVAKKGADYAAKELARVQKVLAGDKITPAKRTEFQLKQNILAAFK